ncbi:MAG: asparagine synthase (glutamine-hydrolyzing) [Elusimicrobia bacterium]|nr:asparagine synthase (glutamine-hydrolyzing) [Elusimicrobiota bacterium]
MCGICGVFENSGDKVALDTLKRMNGLIIHRGPDDEGYYVEGGMGLAMRRLSIIDLPSGHQPISNENSTVWVVLNGEIYNFRQLRAELEAKGHSFSTNSDTEVIVHLYEELGRDCVKKLRGMFAFALWDGNKRQLLLARDRIGKKPLNYCLHEGKLAFSSELRSLLALDWVPREINLQAVDLFLSLQYIPSPHSIYRAINKLEPGHTLLVDSSGKADLQPYWDLPVNQPKLEVSPDEACELVRGKLKEATSLRMISDVPLGAFLSGGHDSSIVVALMSQLSSQPVKTFSVGFEEAEFSELKYAKAVADMYGCEHHEFIVKPEMADILPKLAWHYSEPYGDPSALPTYYVARETRRHVTVALNGDGGDENFAGYLRYVAMGLAHYWDLMPEPARALAAKLAEHLPEKNAPRDLFWRAKRFLRSGVLADFPTRHAKMVCFFNDDETDRLYTDGFKAALGSSLHSAKRYLAQPYQRAAGEDFVNRMLYVDFKTYLPECLMAKVDIAAMANSLEGRSPMLDHEFVELVYSLKGGLKLHGPTGTKWLLKRAFRQQLPEIVRDRSKQGFGIPLGQWFRGELKGFWEQHCLSAAALGRGYFREDVLRGMCEEHQSRRRDHGYRLWALLMLELWHETFENGARV